MPAYKPLIQDASGRLQKLAATDSLGPTAIDAVLQTPQLLTYAASVTVDVSAKNDFAIVCGAGNVIFNFPAFVSGRQGTILFQQDSVGSRTVAFAINGDQAAYTLRRDISLLGGVQPQAAANSLTLYNYQMVLLATVKYLIISRSMLG